jgi:hypothetical protein
MNTGSNKPVEFDEEDPCRRKRIEFQICERKLGFNDKVCRCTNLFI